MHGRRPVRVIFVTDGDPLARQAVETAAQNLGLRVVSASAGNPTPLSGPEIVALIQQAPRDPVLVMVDDRGHSGLGRGEQALLAIARHPDIRVIGAVAVASDSWRGLCIPVDRSIARDGSVVPGPVGKDGRPLAATELQGDTVGVLRALNLPAIVGIGDLGKQEGADSPAHGAQLTTRAIAEVLRLSGCRSDWPKPPPERH